MLKLEQIYEPVLSGLDQVRYELKKVESDLYDDITKDIFEHYFKYPGKLLRPALVMLSAGTCDPEGFERVKQKLVLLSLAIELIHGASLIHDDIIDEDDERRGQKTLNKAFGNRTAVLAGDVLYSKAFSILSGTFPHEFSQLILNVARKMSLVELGQLVSPGISGMKMEYLELINGKTALLMGASCALGARVSGAQEDKISLLGKYGIKFGLCYQITDDYIDNDPLGTKNVKPDDAERYSNDAKLSISGFVESEYKKSLYGLVDYVLYATGR